MKIVKYDNKIVKYDDGIVIKPEPPIEPTYSTHLLKYSSNNCEQACGIAALNVYYTLPDVVILSLNDVLHTNRELNRPALSGYYSDNIDCYWVDGVGKIVDITECT